MYNATVAFDSEALTGIQLVASVLSQATTRRIKKDVVGFVRHETDKRLEREPGPVVHPVEWESTRQMRAYFATDGFGAGIPYVRSHGLVNAWSVVVDYTNTLSSITVENLNPVATYVYGFRQQRFHRNTGWPFAPDILQAVSIQANERLEYVFLDMLHKAIKEGRYGAILNN